MESRGKEDCEREREGDMSKRTRTEKKKTREGERG